MTILFGVEITITFLLGLLGYFCYDPTLFTNYFLAMIKNKETGAFDVQLGGLTWTLNSMIFNNLCWKNPFICGFTSPYFARVGSFSVAVDIVQCIQALLDPTNHVIVIRSLEITDIEVYIEKVAEENPGPSLNLWAALGSKDDHEATNVHSMMQQSITKVSGGGGGKGGSGGMFDIKGLIKTAANAATPDRVEGVFHSAFDMLTSEGDDHKANATHAAEMPEQPVAAAAAVEQKGLPYKVQLSHFAIKELTLHVPAYLGAAAPPIKLSGVSLSDLSNAAGASVEDLVMKVIGQVTQQILAKNPMMAMVGMIGGGMQGGLGGVGDALQGGLGGALQGGLGEGLGQVDGLMSSVMKGGAAGGGDLGGALGSALGGLPGGISEGLPGGLSQGLSGVLGGAGGGGGDILGGLGGLMSGSHNSNQPAGLPAGWAAHVDPASGNTFYVNSATNETTWEKPQHTQADDLPSGWTAHVDPASGNTFYVNSATNESSWEKPQHRQAIPNIPGLPGNLGALGNAFGGKKLGGFRF